jgi:hypothetical protein
MERKQKAWMFFLRFSKKLLERRLRVNKKEREGKFY